VDVALIPQFAGLRHAQPYLPGSEMGEWDIGHIEADGAILVHEDLMLPAKDPLLQRLRPHVLGPQLLLALQLWEDGPFPQGLLGLLEFPCQINGHDLRLPNGDGVPAAGASIVDAMLAAELALPDPQLHLDRALLGRLLHESLRPAVHAYREYRVGGGLRAPVLGLLGPGHAAAYAGHRAGVHLDPRAPGHRLHDRRPLQRGQVLHPVLPPEPEACQQRVGILIDDHFPVHHPMQGAEGLQGPL